MHEGVKRLAVVLGCAGAVAHLVLITLFVPDFEQSIAIYLRIAVNTALCFLVPFGLVYGTAWTIGGFRPSSSNQPQSGLNQSAHAADDGAVTGDTTHTK